MPEPARWRFGLQGDTGDRLIRAVYESACQFGREAKQTTQDIAGMDIVSLKTLPQVAPVGRVADRTSANRQPSGRNRVRGVARWLLHDPGGGVALRASRTAPASDTVTRIVYEKDCACSGNGHGVFPR